MVHKIKNIVILFFSLMLPVVSCVEPITPVLNEDDSESVLVVDAQISNEEGPFKIKLTTSIPVNVMYYPKPVLHAVVLIRDDHGNEYLLEGDDQGRYETAEKNLKGIPGYSYTLLITTPDEIKYMSLPVTMQEGPEIDSVYFEEATSTRFEDGQPIEETRLNILLDAHDPLGIAKYWYYEFEETWEVKLLTDHILVDHSAPGTPGAPSWERITVSDEKITCWVTMPSASILVASTTNNQVDEIKRFRLQSLGPDEDKLHISYSILAKQSCLSHEQYEYWKQLRDANENTGGIYDKIPARIHGNITGDDGKIHALGNFTVLYVKSKRLFINKQDHHVKTTSAYQGCIYYDFYQLPWIPKSFFGTIEGTDTEVYCSSEFCADCREYGSNTKPDFWK